MIVVKVELWPHGNQSRARELGALIIANDATGTPERGNYRFSFSKLRGKVHAGTVRGFPRKSYSVFRLIKLCLNSLEVK
jgi:hypothetical protein